MNFFFKDNLNSNYKTTINILRAKKNLIIPALILNKLRINTNVELKNELTMTKWFPEK